MANQHSIREKKEYREKFQRLLSSTSGEERGTWSALICGHLSRWIGLNNEIRVIATYASLDTEANLSALHLSLKEEYEFAYPLVSGKELTFHVVPHPDQLQRGSFNILEPDYRRHRILKADSIDLCLCPGIAFTPDGARLGRGKAFYDSYLPLLNQEALRVGIALEPQIHDYLPTEKHDILMTHIASPSGVRPTPEAAD